MSVQRRPSVADQLLRVLIKDLIQNRVRKPQRAQQLLMSVVKRITGKKNAILIGVQELHGKLGVTRKRSTARSRRNIAVQIGIGLQKTDHVTAGNHLASWV